MLARTPTFTCIECGRTDAAPGFQWHGGDPTHGPAYWSDRGVLCSPPCALNHYRKREAQGDLPQRPADAPFRER